MFYLEHYGLTDAGKVRENNEDSLLLGSGEDETLFAVADGIGGFEAGEVASRIAVGVLERMDPDDSFEDAVREANRRIRTAAKGDERLAGMGTTIVAVRFGGTMQNPTAEIAHVGDSRAYLLRGKEMKPITEDHSLVAELVRSGDLTRAEAADHPQKNLITRALGAEENVTTDASTLTVQAKDRFLLCSDGLSDMVREEKIQAILNESPDDPEIPAKRLLSEALEAGGSDNITIIVVDVREREAPEEKSRDRSSGTREMRAVSPEAARGGFEGARSKARKGSSSRRRGSKRKSKLGKVLGGIIRGAAALAVLALLLSPAYLWGSTRHYLDEDNGEVVAYRGLPYTVAGISLNEEVQRTGLAIEEVAPAYRDPIQNNTYYEREDIEQVLDQMEADARQNEQEEREAAEERQNEQERNATRDRGN